MFVVPVSVALKVGVKPGTKLAKASLRVMVTVDVAEPFAVVGVVPVIVEVLATGIPGSN